MAATKDGSHKRWLPQKMVVIKADCHKILLPQKIVATKDGILMQVVGLQGLDRQGIELTVVLIPTLGKVYIEV